MSRVSTAPTLRWVRCSPLFLALWVLMFGSLAGAAPPGDYRHLEGEWIGDYGPNGLERVNVTVVANVIVATKVTGDDHVPAGNATFWGSLVTNEVRWHMAKEPDGPLYTWAGRITHASADRITVEALADPDARTGNVLHTTEFRRPPPDPAPKKK